jgi:hypothetical protein
MTVTVVVVRVVVGVPAPEAVLLDPALRAAPGVIAGSAATAPAPNTSTVHHARSDLQPSRSTRAAARCRIGPANLIR